MSLAALVDLDGTLVDANYQHALAWQRAFRREGIVVPMWRLHRHVGMGGDVYVRAVGGDEVEERVGDRLRDVHGEEFGKLREECDALPGVRELLVELKRRGVRVVLATSSNEDDLGFFLDRLGIEDVIDGYTTGDDVARTKPHPDVVQAALQKAGTETAVMLGDSPWDVKAAARAGLQTISVLTGGFADQELREAGATNVFETLVELQERIDETPLSTI